MKCFEICMHFRYALRQLRKNLGFTMTAVLTLAIGIGATTAIFSLVYAVLLQPLPFPKPDRLVWLSQQDHSLPGTIAEPLSYPDYFDWRAQNHSFEGILSYRGVSVILQRNGEPQVLEAQAVSSNFFQVMGVSPMLGRDFRWDEEKPDNHAVILSYALWQSTFGADKNIVGRTIRMGNFNYTVAGVMPKSYRFLLDTPEPELWVSLAQESSGVDPVTAGRGEDGVHVIGRLKPGVTIKQAKADLDVIAANIARQYPDTNKWCFSALAVPEVDHLVGDTRPAMRILFGAVALVLLIACANVAGLLLARASQRQSEFAVRTAIGASRAEIIRQMLSESIVLSLCGGVAGVTLASGVLKGIVALLPLKISQIGEVSLNLLVLAFAVVLSVLTGVLFGILPAWRMAKVEPSSAMREGMRSITGGRSRHSLQSGLVVAQTAVGLVLLIGSGLLIRSFIHILNVNPGFDPRHVLTARLGVPFDDHYPRETRYQLYQQTIERLAAQPGVQSVSAGWPIPFSDSHATVSLAIEGRPVAKGDEPSESIAIVMPGYFETMRIPLLSGRTFTDRDETKSAPVVMVNEAFAKKYFPGENPVGKHIRSELGDGLIDRPMREIVGVVGDTKHKGMTADVEPEYYLPYSQAMITNPYFTIRTKGNTTGSNASGIERAIRDSVSQIDSSVPVYSVSSLEKYVAQSEAQQRFQTVLLSCFAGMALLLSAIGLYGLLSYIVVQRTFEIGLRMAIGAQRKDMLQMILRRGLQLTAAGLGIGLVASVLLTRSLSRLLYGVQPLDLATFAIVSIVLLAVSAIASFVPAWRAAQLDPMETLRDQ